MGFKSIAHKQKGRDTKVRNVGKNRGQRELFCVNTELVEWTSSENLNRLNIDLWVSLQAKEHVHGKDSRTSQGKDNLKLL